MRGRVARAARYKQLTLVGLACEDDGLGKER